MVVRKLGNWNVFESAALEGGWLREVLSDEDFFLALRDGRVDVYYRGAVVFGIGLQKNGLAVKTHVKYLMRNEQKHATLKLGKFDYSSYEPMQRDYEEQASLKHIKSAIQYYTRDEKNGVHKAIIGDQWVIDIEVAFSSRQEEENDGPERIDQQRSQDRVDAVCLVKSSDAARLVFWEAKHFGNLQLFTDEVVKQVEKYEDTIKRRKKKSRMPTVGCVTSMSGWRSSEKNWALCFLPEGTALCWRQSSGVKSRLSSTRNLDC